MIYIDLPYACFALVVENGKVVRAPPIAKWALGRNTEVVVKYYRDKKAKVQVI